MTVSYLHLLQKDCIRVGESTITLANVRARVEEVDSEVGIVSFYTLGNVLDHGNMEWYWQPIDRQNHSLIFSVWKDIYEFNIGKTQETNATIN